MEISGVCLSQYSMIHYVLRKDMDFPTINTFIYKPAFDDSMLIDEVFNIGKPDSAIAFGIFLPFNLLPPLAIYYKDTF